MTSKDTNFFSLILAIRDYVEHTPTSKTSSKKTEQGHTTENGEQHRFLLITIVKTSVVKNRNYFCNNYFDIIIAIYEQSTIYPRDAHM